MLNSLTQQRAGQLRKCALTFPRCGEYAPIDLPVDAREIFVVSYMADKKGRCKSISLFH
jgi:hypothetical protein